VGFVMCVVVGFVMYVLVVLLIVHPQRDININVIKVMIIEGCLFVCEELLLSILSPLKRVLMDFIINKSPIYFNRTFEKTVLN